MGCGSDTSGATLKLIEAKSTVEPSCEPGRFGGASHGVLNTLCVGRAGSKRKRIVLNQADYTLNGCAVLDAVTQEAHSALSPGAGASRRAWGDYMRSVPLTTGAEARDNRIAYGNAFASDLVEVFGAGAGGRVAAGGDAPPSAGLSPVHNSRSFPDAPWRWQGVADSRIATRCGVAFATNGNIAKITLPTVESKGAGPPPAGRDASRGDVGPFTRKSRRRFLNLLNSIDREKMPASRIFFVTLTYHFEWGSTFVSWKRNLDALWKRFEEEYAERCGVPVRTPQGVALVPASMVWKLEFQRRRAPHFHCLLLWMGEPPAMDEFRSWLALNWAQVVAGRGRAVDPMHLAAGTQCDAAEGWNGAASYAAKYCGKQTEQLIDEETGEIHKNGRWWGVKRKVALPVSYDWEPLTEEQAVAVRRVLQRKMVQEASTASEPNPQVTRWRKGRRGRKMADETVYVLASTVRRLVAWARAEKPIAEPGEVAEVSSAEIVQSLYDEWLNGGGLDGL